MSEAESLCPGCGNETSMMVMGKEGVSVLWHLSLHPRWWNYISSVRVLLPVVVAL